MYKHISIYKKFKKINLGCAYKTIYYMIPKFVMADNCHLTFLIKIYSIIQPNNHFDHKPNIIPITCYSIIFNLGGNYYI